MELSHLLQLVAEIPENSTLNYVRSTDACRFIDVDVSGARINAEAPNGEPKSWAPSYLKDLASKIKENVPFNLSGLLNNKGSFRPVLETILAHTREFYTVRKGTATALAWIPSKPKNELELEEISADDIPDPKPELNNSNLLPPDELAKKVKEGFIKFWRIIDQHGVDFESYVRSFENTLNPYLEKLDLGYSSIFQIVDYRLYGSVIKQITEKFPECAYITNGRQNNGLKYVIGSTNLHYSNYLQILGNSDFRANIDNEKEEYQKNRPMSLQDKPLQLIYYGAPGTGKSFSIDAATNEDNSVRTTFHPDSDYASFVGAYKPTMAPMPINAFVGTTVHHAKNADNEKAYEKKIVYKYVPQAFMKAYVEAWKRYTPDEDVPYYLVIEEINRGNCAQIFGDLFQLLDRNNQGCSSYAISADEDIAQFLRDDENGFAKLSEDQRQAIGNFILVKDSGKEEHIGHSIMNGSKLLLPPNLRIWATMNTSDQSLFPIDSAFKRRWNWKYMPIDYHPIDNRTGKPIDWKFQIGDALYSWGEFLGKINPEIYTLNESSDKQMGYFFAKADPSTGVISEEVFLNKVLFYLWTDVFKDYDVSSEIFRNEKKNRSFIFTDFFDKEQPTALANFVGNLKLTQLEIDIDSIKDEDSSDMEISVNNQGQRDFSRYSINGEGKYNKRQTVLQSLRLYIEINPTLTAADVISNWNKANPQIPFFILSSSEYETRIAEYPNQRDRFWSVTTGTGEKVYVTNQWNTNRIAEFMNMMNNSGFGIHIEKVAE